MSVEEVFQEIVKDEHFYRNSGGGVTASGGEPPLPAKGAAELDKGVSHAWSIS